MDNTTRDNFITAQLPLSNGSELRPISANTTTQSVELHGSLGARLWRSALHKIRSRDVVFDPWRDFDLEGTPTLPALRHRYSAIKKKWIKDDILVKIEQSPFDRGAMRECFRLKKAPINGDWDAASNYVAKRYISDVSSSVYLDDVRLQMEAKLWAEAFNRQNPPKKVDVFQMAVIEILDETRIVPKHLSETCRSEPVTTTNASVLNKPEPRFYHIERYMDGDYRKYNSNVGFVDEKLRNTPQAFSHFTFERSGHRLLVVDIQGVGDLYTDPQIHTADGIGYNDGNLGLRGMALFFHTHRCNPLCAWLGLTPFDLSTNEVALLPGNPEGQDDYSADEADAGEEDDDFVERSETSNVELASGSLSPLELQPPYQQNKSFGIFGVQPRRRSSSISGIPTAGNMQNFKWNRRVFGPTVVRDCEYTREPRMRTLSCSSKPFVSGSVSPSDCAAVASFGGGTVQSTGAAHIGRQRQVSEDSGVGFPWAGAPCPPSRRLSSTLSDGPIDNSICGSPLAGFTDVFQDYSWQIETQITSDIGGSGGCGDGTSTFCGFQSQYKYPQQPYRRTRTISDSSDVDDLEVAVRMTANSLHQIMHENQKPSSAAHPSNLDQELGQSVLGQIHHELARLHEAGRFLKRPGGWLPSGLGGIHLEGSEVSGSITERSTSPAGSEVRIDWESVLFHERQAAQLGCLEALIIMAHYYLGLPTQLLSECPIKAREEDIGLGVDYLYRCSEGGDRRCMILLARYLDASVIFSGDTKVDPFDRVALKSALNLASTPVEDFLVLFGSSSFPISVATGSSKPWAEAVSWYRRAIENAGLTLPGSPATVDEGCDAEGRYDAAEDLWPVHRLLARMAEMYVVDGHGLPANYTLAGDLFSEAAELTMQLSNGRLTSKYFELAEEAYAKAE
uniref:Eukaryotic elongation factor 2 kinase n=1 Tax=Schistocephalus solidus TaxID=70667 RepID=A0A0X3Q1X7_SCHSO